MFQSTLKITLMNTKFLLPFIVLVMCTISCSNDDSNNDDFNTNNEGSQNTEEEIPVINSYYGLTLGDNWQYDVTVDDQAPTVDSLEVTGDIIIEGKSFSDFTANMPNAGFMTNLLDNGGLREENSVLYYSGSISIPITDTENFETEVNDLILYDESKADGTVLAEISESYEQTVDNLPLKIDITIKSIQNELLENYTQGSFSFEKALKATYEITASVNTEFLGFPIPIVNEQKVVTSTNIYGLNVGIINSETDLTVTFEDLSVINITLDDIDTSTLQVIKNYAVTID